MKPAIIQSLIAGSLLSLAGFSYSAPALTLTDSQMDTVSAGGQYSVVSGEAYAGMGTVEIRSSSEAVNKSNGTTKTKADLKLNASGTDLVAAAGGESGINGQFQSVYGAAETDEGRIRMRVKTMAKTKKDGEVIMKTKMKIMEKTKKDGEVTMKTKIKISVK